MSDNVRGRVRFVPAAVLLASVLCWGTGAMAQMFDRQFSDLAAFCAKVATMDEQGLRTLDSLISREIEKANASDDRNPLVRIKRQLDATAKDIAAKQRRIASLVARIADMRKAADTSRTDSTIKAQEDILAKLQKQRLALHAGENGNPGIDRLIQLIAEIDRRIAAKDYVTGAEQTAAENDKRRYTQDLQKLQADKASLAGDYAAAQAELARLKQLRDSLNPQKDKLKELETELAAEEKALEQLRKGQQDLRESLDQNRDAASVYLLGAPDLRACIANRRKELASAQPPAPPKTDEPKTPTTPPQSAAVATFALSGTWSGQCNGKFAVGGQFKISAAAGKISGSYSGGDSGSIGGQVNGAGQLSASGGGGGGGRTVRWNGQVAQAGGGWGGSGRWTSSGEGIACDGAWQAR